MCTGMEMLAGASLGLGVLGTATNVAGQAAQANAAANQANYLAQVARNNQTAMEANAQLALQQGEVGAQQKQLQTAQIEGKQRAVLASQGTDVNSGSPLDIVADTARAGYTDVATVRSNAALQAYGYRLQGAGLGAAAGNYQLAGANALGQLPYGIGSSLLSGASSVADKWMAWQRYGGGGATQNLLTSGQIGGPDGFAGLNG